MKKFVNFMMTIPILLATLIPVIFCVLFLFVWFLVLHSLYGNNFPPMYRDLGGGIGLLIASFSGLIQVLRRERPGFTFGKPLRGRIAIVEGIMVMGMFGLIGIVLIIAAFFEK